MAAYIARQHEVKRVVLFSSPWDFTGADRTPRALAERRVRHADGPLVRRI